MQRQFKVQPFCGIKIQSGLLLIRYFGWNVATTVYFKVCRLTRYSPIKKFRFFILGNLNRKREKISCNFGQLNSSIEFNECKFCDKSQFRKFQGTIRRTFPHFNETMCFFTHSKCIFRGRAADF